MTLPLTDGVPLWRQHSQGQSTQFPNEHNPRKQESVGPCTVKIARERSPYPISISLPSQGTIAPRWRIWLKEPSAPPAGVSSRGSQLERSVCMTRMSDVSDTRIDAYSVGYQQQYKRAKRTHISVAQIPPSSRQSYAAVVVNLSRVSTHFCKVPKAQKTFPRFKDIRCCQAPFQRT